MNPKFLALAFLFSSMGLLPSAQAALTGLIAEPYLGYGLFGSISSNNADGGSFNGYGMGLRGGVEIADLFFGAVDFGYFPSLNVTVNSATPVGGGASNSKLGLVAGINVPLLPFRFWIGYNFLDKINGTYPQAGSYLGTSASPSGSSFKIGAGFKLIPLISLNAEYFFSNYGSSTLTASNTPLSISSMTTQMLLLSASIPLNY